MKLPFVIEPRREKSRRSALIAPIVAVILTVLSSIALLRGLGIPADRALYFLYVAPMSSKFNIMEVILKMSPLLLMAQALAIGFRARIWNIGAEGQLILGAIGGSLLPIWLGLTEGIFLLPAMIMVGAVFGMAWASIAAVLRARLNANEILVTLMLNSIALQLLYYLVSGPLRDPMGFNFPQSALLPPAAMLPTLMDGMRANVSIFLGLAATVLAWVYMERSLPGFRLQVSGLSPGAAQYAGFSERRAIWFSLLLGGLAAGIVGVCELAGPLGQLQRVVSPGYGFAASIVAILGGLNAWGILAAAFFMSVVYVGGDIAQAGAGVPYTVNTTLQGLLLLYYIAARVFSDYRVRLQPARRAEAKLP
jgi:general nucleoside transport system permease protein